MGGFEWDEEKNLANRRKHGISFDEAVEIFAGLTLTHDDAHPDEPRERSYGLLGGIVVVCVIHTDRDGTTRIISARRATRHERSLFDAYLRQASR